MPLSTAEKSYYTARRNRAMGFIKRLTERYQQACELHEIDVAECDAKLTESDSFKSDNESSAEKQLKKSPKI